MGKKASNYEVIGLCAIHHRHSKESYHYSPKDLQKVGSQKALLEENLKLVGCCNQCH